MNGVTDTFPTARHMDRGGQPARGQAVTTLTSPPSVHSPEALLLLLVLPPPSLRPSAIPQLFQWGKKAGLLKKKGQGLRAGC